MEIPMVRTTFVGACALDFQRPRRTAILAFGVAVFAVATATSSYAAMQITGAGSTFDFPFFSRAFYEYSRKNPDVTIDYQPIGSGGGIERFIAKTVDFGATDVPMNVQELSRAPGEVLQIPVTLGGVGIAYNLPEIQKGLKLTREVVADIYLGKITKWNDGAIAKLNPGVKLTDMPITVVHRFDESGTTYIFTEFLSNFSPEWKQKVGTGKSVQWPISVGGKGNEGVAGLVQETSGAIGYVELAYLLENEMPYALLQNKAGKYLYPSIDTVAAAAATKPVSDTDFSIVDTDCDECYPISGYSWVILYKKPADPQRGKLLNQIMNWLVTEGQAVAKTVHHALLPENVKKQAQQVLSQMQ